MKDQAATPTYLADYKPPAWLVRDVELNFRLHPKATRVKSRIRFTPNPATTDRRFWLDGENLTLLSAYIDGVAAKPEITEKGLRCDVPAAPFVWEAEVEISPEDNTSLEGLYMSNGMYCTQCEAEGFRKITYYPDRPDVMATFHVEIDSSLPVRLSNGDLKSETRSRAVWQDPWPKRPIFSRWSPATW